MLRSETAVLIDGETGQVLLDKNMNQRMSPASITKIMTALLALENGRPDDIITMSHDAVFSIGRGTSHIALDTNETLSLDQALYALAIASANDAANGIAELIGGSMENFALMMTERAREAGAFDTNFANAHGLTDSSHYTTAYDMAMITREAIKNPRFNEIFSSAYYEIPPTNKQPKTRFLRSTNALLSGKYKYGGIIATKTGWTTDSQSTLVAAAERNGRKLIAVALKSVNPDDKWEDITLLFDYGFDEFIKLEFTSDEILDGYYHTAGTKENNLNISSPFNERFSCLVYKGLTKDDINIEYFPGRERSENEPALKVSFSLGEEYSDFMFTSLGGIELKINSGTNNIVTEISESSQEHGNKALYTALSILGAVALIFILSAYRSYKIKQYRRYRRRYGYKRRKY